MLLSLMHFGFVGSRFATPVQCDNPQLPYHPRLCLHFGVIFIHTTGARSISFDKFIIVYNTYPCINNLCFHIRVTRDPNWIDFTGVQECNPL